MPFDKGTAIETVGGVQELMELCDFVEDERFTNAINLIIKCIAKPDIPPATARRILIEAQGYAGYFKSRALYYANVKGAKGGTDEYRKKSIYMSMSEQLHELAQSLKYLAKDAAQL